MEIKEMNLEQIEARKAEIKKELTNDNADLKSLKEEVKALNEREADIKKAGEERKALLAAIGESGTVVETPNIEGAKKASYGVESKEYRNAYLKQLAVDKDGKKIFGELTKEERDAFTFTTANTGAVVPTIILNRIKDLVSSMSPLYDDSTKMGLAQGFQLSRHTEIAQGDADVTLEGIANDDEEDVFDTVSLDGVEIKKHADLTRKMRFQSITDFENWLVQHIALRILVAKDKVILARLNDESTGIAESNVITGDYSDATIRAAFALIKSNGRKVVYANNTTIYNGLAGITINGSGTKAFVPNSMVDPIEQGSLYSAIVKLDDNIPDNVAYIGVPVDILSNDFDDYSFMRDINAKSWVETFSGYSLFDAGLENPYAFVKVTFTGDSTPSVSLEPATAAVAVSETVKLTAATSPQGAAVVYTSSDTEKATVAQDGTVTGVAAGDATITATITDIYGETYSDTSVVTVSAG